MTERKTRNLARRHNRQSRTRAGFTLIEMMVALAIFMLMMAIIFVPLNMGVNFFHMGRARSEVQQAAQLSMNKIVADLRQATFVFPNDITPGITDQLPYTNGDAAGHPYYQAQASDTVDQTVDASGNSRGIACNSPVRKSNTGRIDFILPTLAANGIPITPVSAGPYLITYYARRLATYDATGNPLRYDPVDNPIVLFRAQIPIKDDTTPTPNVYADISAARYTPSSCPGANDPYLWLTQSVDGEPNLQSIAVDRTITTGTLTGLHDQVTPRGMGLIAPHAQDDQNSQITPALPPNYTPETSFICSDTNGDGKIDHVRVTIVMGQFDAAGYQPTAQSVRISQEVDLPNIQ